MGALWLEKIPTGVYIERSRNNSMLWQKIIPFKAVRPTRDKVGLIACRAYQDYSIEKRNARLRDNPYSFLQIINPGYKYDKKISGSRRFNLVRNRYLEFKEDGNFIQDKKPSYYIL